MRTLEPRRWQQNLQVEIRRQLQTYIRIAEERVRPGNSRWEPSAHHTADFWRPGNDRGLLGEQQKHRRKPKATSRGTDEGSAKENFEVENQERKNAEAKKRGVFQERWTRQLCQLPLRDQVRWGKNYPLDWAAWKSLMAVSRVISTGWGGQGPDGVSWGWKKRWQRWHLSIGVVLLRQGREKRTWCRGM